ncbi:hypothetical protein QQF64_004738 [Cirrhinus molitorella]|uniref:Uncharacterized protein n=1 Tax=Cirrhinus molitorella TaxID=172907 RepID=A0ABR3MH49_9TELE
MKYERRSEMTVLSVCRTCGQCGLLSFHLEPRLMNYTVESVGKSASCFTVGKLLLTEYISKKSEAFSGLCGSSLYGKVKIKSVSDNIMAVCAPAKPILSSKQK